MKRLFKKLCLLTINYTCILPLLFFLVATNQINEMNELVSALKVSSQF